MNIELLQTIVAEQRATKRDTERLASVLIPAAEAAHKDYHAKMRHCISLLGEILRRERKWSTMLRPLMDEYGWALGDDDE